MLNINACLTLWICCLTVPPGVRGGGVSHPSELLVESSMAQKPRNVPSQLAFGEIANEAQIVAGLPLVERSERAIALIRANEPEGAYYLAFSGGKDSCVIKHLASVAGVRFDPWYNNTTIDPPELVRFIKRHHGDVRWSEPEHGNMFYRIATNPAAPPTRQWRWCCSEYKEGNGNGRVKIFGVRAAESRTRKHFWRDLSTDLQRDVCVCPVVYWTDAQIWEYIRANRLPYCELYDEGWTRLGCVACPLKSERQQESDFRRWPHYEKMWKRSVIANWEKWKDVPNSKTGEPRFHARFKTGEEFWHWWLTHKHPDVFREDCQSGILWTNEDEPEPSAVCAPQETPNGRQGVEILPGSTAVEPSGVSLDRETSVVVQPQKKTRCP